MFLKIINSVFGILSAAGLSGSGSGDQASLTNDEGSRVRGASSQYVPSPGLLPIRPLMQQLTLLSKIFAIRPFTETTIGTINIKPTLHMTIIS